jgi:rhodanese-related sulfurtransferase
MDDERTPPSPRGWNILRWLFGPAERQSPREEVPRRVGRYRVIELLGEGGAGLPADVPKDRPIVVYCGQVNCDAALKVAEGLQALGFTRVSAFLGGFRAWDEAGYPADTNK